MQLEEAQSLSRGAGRVNTGDAIIIDLLAILVALEVRKLVITWFNSRFLGIT